MVWYNTSKIMDFNSTIDIIIKDLDEARAIIDDLRKYPGVPALQIELARAKCKSAAEIMAILKNFQNAQPVRPSEGEIHPAVAEETKNSAPYAEKKQPLTVEKAAPVSAKEAKQPWIADAMPADVYGPEILADKFSIDDPGYIKPSHLSSLSEAIGINDRFLFLREIFDDNRDLYAQVISKLDQIRSLEDARSIIMSYTRDEDSKIAGRQLLDLVKRKLSSDE